MKNKTISIIGLGFVGLPLACILATKFNNKCKIIGIDKKIKNSKINKKKFLLSFEKNLVDKRMRSTILQSLKKNNFELSDDIKKIYNSETIVVSVNFDFKANNIEKSYKKLKTLFKNIALNIKTETLIILETTVPPGTSEKIIFPLIKKF